MTTTAPNVAPAPGTDGPWIVNPFIAQVEDKDGPICQLLWPTDIRSEEVTWRYAQMIASAPALAAENARLIAENAALRKALQELKNRCDWSINFYERNGPSYTSQGTGVEYEHTSDVQNLMREFSDIAARAASKAARPSPPASAEGERLCEDCPPADYPTDKTRCEPCPRRAAIKDQP